MSGPPDFRLEHSEFRAADEFGEFASEDLPYYADWHGSFEKLPWALDEEALRGADVAVVGAPFDEGVSSWPGARFGPRAIRMAPTAWSRTGAWSIQAETEPYARLTVVDAGDAPVAPGRSEVVIADAIGDALDGPDCVYLSVDIDVVDPGMAPATGTPEAGGMLPRELLQALRQIVGRAELAGMDVVEVSPPYDHAEVTAILAHRTVMEAISALAVQRGMMRGPQSLARGLDGLTGAGRLGEAGREAH